MVSFTNAIKNFYLKAFKFKGRATRAEFWWVELYYLLVFCLFIFLTAITDVPQIMGCGGVFLGVHIIPMLSLQVRRFHDIGYSAWSLLFYAIPYIGSLICLFLFAWPGDKYANGYEDDSYNKNLKTIEIDDVKL